MRIFILFLGLLLGFSSQSQTLPPPSLKLPDSSGQATNNAVLESNLPQLKVSVRVLEKEIYQAEPFSYLIELEWEKSPNSCEIELKLEQVPKAEGLKAISAEFESENVLEGENEKVRVVHSLGYFPEQTGKSIIDKAEFSYRCYGQDSWTKISAPAFPIEVLPRRFHLSDIAQNRYFQIGAGLVFLAGVMALVILFIKNRAKSREKESEQLVVSPQDRAKQLLREADQFRIAGRYADYFLSLEQTLRFYLAERFSIRSTGKDALVEKISKELDSELALGIKEFLNISDKVKFAGWIPSGSELDKAYQVVLGLIEFERKENLSGGER